MYVKPRLCGAWVAMSNLTKERERERERERNKDILTSSKAMRQMVYKMDIYPCIEREREREREREMRRKVIFLCRSVRKSSSWLGPMGDWLTKAQDLNDKTCAVI